MHRRYQLTHNYIRGAIPVNNYGLTDHGREYPIVQLPVYEEQSDRISTHFCHTQHHFDQAGNRTPHHRAAPALVSIAATQPGVLAFDGGIILWYAALQE